ncbi:MAG: hypothetical protein WCF24_03835 [Acidimicrobiales bacterium]
MDDEHEISYLALEIGTPVQSSEGHTFGTVEHVLQIPSEDLFDGIVVATNNGHRFVDKGQIREITTEVVYCFLNDEQVSQLPPPSGPPSMHVDPFQDTGPSLSARWGRLFGRERWTEDK